MYRFEKWLKENRSVPSIAEIDHLACAFGHTFATVPWDAIDFGYGAKRSVTKLKRRRFDLKELPQADSVGTFGGKTYELHDDYIHFKKYERF